MVGVQNSPVRAENGRRGPRDHPKGLKTTLDSPIGVFLRFKSRVSIWGRSEEIPTDLWAMSGVKKLPNSIKKWPKMIRNSLGTIPGA